MRSSLSIQRFSRSRGARYATGLLVVIILSVGANAQQKAKVRVEVSPRQAYIFLDGKPIGENHRNLTMAPGKHTISVHNYGYIPQSREIEAKAGTNDPLSFTLTPSGAPVSGPMGAIQLEGPGRAAVFLNGKTPDYFVGHVDEFNNHIVWKQQLLVPPGTHELTVVYEGKEIWSRPVEVAANKRVIIWLDNGGHWLDNGQFDTSELKVQDWKPATVALPRFKAGTASATVVVAPVKNQLAIAPTTINCSQPANMTWSSTDAVQAMIASQPGAQEEVPLKGERNVSPHQTTSYKLVAMGPGGKAESNETLQVNPEVTSSFSSSTSDLHYVQSSSGLQKQSATLTWSTTNADKVEISPLGVVSASGSQVVNPDASSTYVLTATNVCGGSSTRQVAIQVQVEPAAEVPTVASVFFPTDYPKKGKVDVGLVASQKQILTKTAAAFKQYMQAVPNAKLLLQGHTDPRGDKAYNQALSERRVTNVRNFLVSQGVPPDRIGTEAFGEEKQLSDTTITNLETTNPQKTDLETAKQQKIMELAYNRRVDVILTPADKMSSQYFPNAAPDSDILRSPAPPPASELK
jgi:hypothetical protein